MRILSRWRILLLTGFIFIVFLVRLRSSRLSPELLPELPFKGGNSEKYDWARVPQHYPVEQLISLPKPVSHTIPKIQAKFRKETADERNKKIHRLAAVKGNFTHAWQGYKEHAWLHDEVAPLSGSGLDPFGGWAATLVDSLGRLS
jgi:mannosyl-oligosaccharide alpha-1,2-mannosidase